VPPGTPHNAKCPPARHRHAKCITAHHKGRGGWEELEGLEYASTETEGPPIADTWITIVIRPYLLRWPLREESLTPTKQPRLTSSSALLSELRAHEVEGRLEEVLEEEEGVGRRSD
jgi:hypothetical protein